MPSSSVLIAGAGPGLGLAVARRFGREGRPVALLSRHPGRHESYLASLRADGVTALAVAADITRPERLRAAVDTGGSAPSSRCPAWGCSPSPRRRCAPTR